MRKKVAFKNPIIPWLFLLAASLLLASLIILLSDAFNLETIRRFGDRPDMFLYNWLPIGLVMALLYALSSNLFVSYTLGGGIFLLFGLINKFKLLLRGDPLIPSDLVLGGEVAAVIRKDYLTMTSGVAFSLALFLLVAIVFFFMRGPRLRVKYRIILGVTCLVLMYTSYAEIYCNTDIYNNMPLNGSPYSQTDKFRSRGFVYSFMTHVPFIKTYAKPEGYSAEEAQNILAAYETPPLQAYTGVKPNILVVMDESFWDIDQIPGIVFKDGHDPLAHYRAILPDTYAGYIYTSAFGGGTGNTEFSFLTGINSYFFSGFSIYSTLVRSDIDALPRILKPLGYYSEAIHPGDDWFYNRKNVFAYMGFDKSYFKQDDGFAGAEKKRNYITNQAAADFILQRFDDFKQSPDGKDTPYFSFMVTIENHGPYATDKNLTGIEYFEKPETMTEDVYHMINNYLAGLSSGDPALGKLVKELDQREDPVVLVYFGDHLPFFGNDSLGYKQLSWPIGENDSMESYLNTYRVPYFIWSNRAAKEAYKKEGVTLPTGTAPEMTTCFLPDFLLDYIHFSKNDYFSYLHEVSDVLPVVTGKYDKTKDGFTDTLPEDLQKLVTQYEIICNYKLFDERINK